MLYFALSCKLINLHPRGTFGHQFSMTYVCRDWVWKALYPFYWTVFWCGFFHCQFLLFVTYYASQYRSISVVDKWQCSGSVSQPQVGGDAHTGWVIKAPKTGGDPSVGVGAFSKVVLSCPHQPTRPRRSLDLHYSQAVSLPPPREHEASGTHRLSAADMQ